MPRRERRSLNDRSLGFSKSEWLSLWGVFWISFVVRVFRISQPAELYLEEPRLAAQSTDAWNFFREDSKLQFRIGNAVIGSLVPVGVCTILLAQGVRRTLAVIASLTITFDFACIITSRTWNTRQVFVLLCVCGIAAFVVGDKKRSTAYLMLSAVFCGVSCCFDAAGLVSGVFCFVSVLAGRMGDKARRSIPFLVCPIAALALQLHDGKEWAQKAIHRLGTEWNWYVFPMWKYAPKVVFQSDTMTISLANNPVTIALCTLFCALSFRIESAFYFLSIITVWVIHGVASPSNYHLALVFGAICIGKSLARLPGQLMFALLISVLLMISFIFWSGLIYGFQFNYDESLVPRRPLSGGHL